MFYLNVSYLMFFFCVPEKKKCLWSKKLCSYCLFIYKLHHWYITILCTLAIYNKICFGTQMYIDFNNIYGRQYLHIYRYILHIECKALFRCIICPLKYCIFNVLRRNTSISVLCSHTATQHYFGFVYLHIICMKHFIYISLAKLCCNMRLAKLNVHSTLIMLVIHYDKKKLVCKHLSHPIP